VNESVKKKFLGFLNVRLPTQIKCCRFYRKERAGGIVFFGKIPKVDFGSKRGEIFSKIAFPRALSTRSLLFSARGEREKSPGRAIPEVSTAGKLNFRVEL